MIIPLASGDVRVMRVSITKDGCTGADPTDVPQAARMNKSGMYFITYLFSLLSYPFYELNSRKLQ